MASQAIVNTLRSSLQTQRTKLAARLQAFTTESQGRTGRAGTDVASSLDLLRQVFNQNLSESESARFELENLNTLLAKNVGSAPVGFSRFTNPQKVSSFQARKSPTFGRKQATLGSSTSLSRALGRKPVI